MLASKFADLLSRCDGPALKIERCDKLTSLWAGYGAIYQIVAREGAKGPTRNFVIKSVNPPNASGVSHDRKLHSYEVEASFYKQVAPMLLDRGLSIATPLLAEQNHDASGFHMHLVLTDLRPEFPNPQRPMDLEHAKAALTWLAGLHAAFWQRKVPEELWSQGTFWQLDTRHEELEAMEPEWRDLQKAAQYISDELENTKFNTLVHGDFKAANILFSASSEIKAAVYDFQYCGGGDGMKDVAYFLCSAVENRVLQRHENELLEHYHKTLTAQLPDEAAKEYTLEVMTERLNWAVCDFVRFMAGWGWWGNTSWASERCRKHLKTLSVN